MVCGIDLSPSSEWVLRFASNAAAAAGATLTAIHAIPTREADGPIQLDLDQKANSSVASAVHLELDRLQKASGCGTQVRLGLGPIRDVLLEVARRRDAMFCLLEGSLRTPARVVCETLRTK
jgi:nucleotide-binding universal stress UspA family protein